MFEALLPVICAFVAGCLIGCVGIGGVILVPTLAYLGGIDIHTGIASAMFAYLVSGALGTFIFQRHGSIQWSMTFWLWAGAVPGAYSGALSATMLPGPVLGAGIALLTIGSGIQALRSTNDEGRVSIAGIPIPLLVAIGAVTGFSSALSGTGGPLILIPLLIWLRFPTIAAIGLAQAIQLPIASLATAANIQTNGLDIRLGLLLAAGISLGTLIGSSFAHALPRQTLRRIVALLLTIVGALVLTQLVFAQLHAGS